MTAFYIFGKAEGGYENPPRGLGDTKMSKQQLFLARYWRYVDRRNWCFLSGIQTPIAKKWHHDRVSYFQKSRGGYKKHTGRVRNQEMWKQQFLLGWIRRWVGLRLNSSDQAVFEVRFLENGAMTAFHIFRKAEGGYENPPRGLGETKMSKQQLFLAWYWRLKRW